MIHCINWIWNCDHSHHVFQSEYTGSKETIATLVINREKCPWHSSTVYSSIKTSIKNLGIPYSSLCPHYRQSILIVEASSCQAALHPSSTQSHHSVEQQRPHRCWGSSLSINEGAILVVRRNVKRLSFNCCEWNGWFVLQSPIPLLTKLVSWRFTCAKRGGPLGGGD
jgi:hypothetical protein